MAGEFNVSNNESCEDDDAPNTGWTNMVAIPCLYVIVAAIICLGNILVLDCYRKVESARTVTNVFIMQLAVADLWVGITLPIISAFYIVRKLRLIEEGIQDYCVFSYAMFIFPASASVLGLLLMTLDRFLSILYPLKYRVKMNKRKAYAFAIGVVWLPALSMGFVLPNVWRPDFDKIMEMNPCLNITDCDFVKSLKPQYLQYIFVPGFLIMAVVIFLLYIPILHVVRKHLAEHKINLEKGTTTKFHKNVIQRKEIKMMTTTIFILGAFFLCWMPLMVVVAGEVYFSIDFSKYRSYLYIPTMLNSALNPIIYALRVPVFNRLLCKRIPCLKPLQMEKTSETGRKASQSANEMNQLSVNDLGSRQSVTASTSVAPMTPRKLIFKQPPQYANGQFSQYGNTL